jgi:glycosyltransferase involved in cell wall biosynthesis
LPKIAVVIPLYNEKQQIEKLIAEIIKFYQNYQNSNFTFVLSDDRSTDDTFYILEMRTNKFNNIKVIRNEMNRGYGANSRNGINYSLTYGYDWAVVMDSDLSNPLEDLIEIEKVINENQSAEYIKGNRFGTGKSGFVEVPIRRKVLSIVGNKVSRLILNDLIMDPTNGFRAIKLSKWILVTTTDDSFPVIVEELQKAVENKLRIYEFETKLRYDRILREKSSFNFDANTILSYLKYLVKTRRKIHDNRE